MPNTANAHSDENTAAPSTTRSTINENVNLVGDEDVRGRQGRRGHERPHVHRHVTEHGRLAGRQRQPERYRRLAADRRFGRGRQLQLPGRRLERADDHLLAGASRHGRHEGDHGHLPRASKTAAAASVSNTANATADDGGTGSASDTVEITRHADVADLKVAAATVVAGNDLDVHDHGHEQRPVRRGSGHADRHAPGRDELRHVERAHLPVGSGHVHEQRAEAAGDLRVTIKVTVHLASSFSGAHLVNTAAVATDGTTEPNNTNNTSTSTTTVTRRAEPLGHEDRRRHERDRRRRHTGRTRSR